MPARADNPWARDDFPWQTRRALHAQPRRRQGRVRAGTATALVGCGVAAGAIGGACVAAAVTEPAQAPAVTRTVTMTVGPVGPAVSAPAQRGTGGAR